MLGNIDKATTLMDMQNLKRLAVAVLISALLHWLLLDSFNWQLASSALVHDEIDVVLIPPLIAPAGNASEPSAEKLTQAKPSKLKPTSKITSNKTAQPTHQSTPSPDPIGGDVQNSLVAAPEVSGDNAIHQAEVGLDSKSSTESVAQTGDPKLADSGVVEQLQPPPTQIDMLFDVLHKGKIGEAEVHFVNSTDGHYRLTSERRATGVAAFFVKSKDIEVSEGLVTARGLSPTSFTHQFGKNGQKVHHADFDWATTQLSMQNNGVSNSVTLPQGTQDMLSFMFQFIYVPPLTEMQVFITNGRKLNQYAYRFEGEEEIETSLGKVRTLHIAKNSNESEGKLDLWLGVDYHYLPMKIRKIDKDDKVYEQVITSLKAK